MSRAFAKAIKQISAGFSGDGLEESEDGAGSGVSWRFAVKEQAQGAGALGLLDGPTAKAMAHPERQLIGAVEGEEENISGSGFEGEALFKIGIAKQVASPELEMRARGNRERQGQQIEGTFGPQTGVSILIEDKHFQGRGVLVAFDWRGGRIHEEQDRRKPRLAVSGRLLILTKENPEAR